MKHLFFSYSRQQLHYAEMLVYELQKAKQEVWFDLQRLIPGSNWSNSIEQGIDGCRGLVLLLSKAAYESSNVEKEWRRALRAGKPIFVVLFEDVRLPPELQDTSIIDTRQGFDDTAWRLVECVTSDAVCRDAIPPSRWLPRAMEREPRRVVMTLLIDGLVFVGGVFAVYLSAFDYPADQWINTVYRGLISFSDRLGFLWK